MASQEKTFEENIVQLKKKLERETENRLRDQEKILEHKWKVSLQGSWSVNKRQYSFLKKKSTKILTNVIHLKGNPKAH